MISCVSPSGQVALYARFGNLTLNPRAEWAGVVGPAVVVARELECLKEGVKDLPRRTESCSLTSLCFSHFLAIFHFTHALHALCSSEKKRVPKLWSVSCPSQVVVTLIWDCSQEKLDWDSVLHEAPRSTLVSMLLVPRLGVTPSSI